MSAMGRKRTSGAPLSSFVSDEAHSRARRPRPLEYAVDALVPCPRWKMEAECPVTAPLHPRSRHPALRRDTIDLLLAEPDGSRVCRITLCSGNQRREHGNHVAPSTRMDFISLLPRYPGRVLNVRNGSKAVGPLRVDSGLHCLWGI